MPVDVIESTATAVGFLSDACRLLEYINSRFSVAVRFANIFGFNRRDVRRSCAVTWKWDETKKPARTWFFCSMLSIRIYDKLFFCNLITIFCLFFLSSLFAVVYSSFLSCKMSIFQKGWANGYSGFRTKVVIRRLIWDCCITSLRRHQASAATYLHALFAENRDVSIHRIDQYSARTFVFMSFFPRKIWLVCRIRSFCAYVMEAPFFSKC